MLFSLSLFSSGMLQDTSLEALLPFLAASHIVNKVWLNFLVPSPEPPLPFWCIALCLSPIYCCWPEAVELCFILFCFVLFISYSELYFRAFSGFHFLSLCPPTNRSWTKPMEMRIAAIPLPMILSWCWCGLSTIILLLLAWWWVLKRILKMVVCNW